MEPSPGADPGGTPIPRASGRRSEGHRSGSWTRTSVRLLQGQAGMPSTHPGTDWSLRQVPLLASRPYKAARSLEPGQVRSAGFEPAITWPSTMPVYLFAARAQESRHPVPTRAIRRTKAEPQPCAAAKLPGQDSNLRALGSEPRRDTSNPPGSAMEDASRARMPRRLNSRGLPDCRHTRVRRQRLELCSPD